MQAEEKVKKNIQRYIRISFLITIPFIYLFAGISAWSIVDSTSLFQNPLIILFWPIIFDIFGLLILYVFFATFLLALIPKLLKSKVFLSLLAAFLITGSSILVPVTVDLNRVNGPVRGSGGPGNDGTDIYYGVPFAFLKQWNYTWSKSDFEERNPVMISGARETPTTVLWKEFLASAFVWFVVSYLLLKFFIASFFKLKEVEIRFN